MLFNSVSYFVFLPIMLGLYWTLPQRPRQVALFLGSMVFYAFWRWEFLPLILFQVSVDYVGALLIDRSSSENRRRGILIVCLAINLSLLAFFKYSLFLVENLNGIGMLLGFERISMPFRVILPLGISFYTFHSMSYTIDVYRRFIKPERDFLLFSNYVLFFPQLNAGPILRAREVIWQLARRPEFSIDDIVWGARRIALGLFLKVVLADHIAQLVDTGFNGATASYGAFDVWTLAFLFGLQIYFDFSAYSHIAIGTARLMGIRFPENFNFPYLATSPQDFWRRWHISLSSWIRDYLYLPLSGQRVEDRSTGGLGEAVQATTERRRTVALFVTWTLMGLWHGANWTFVLWGLWHAVVIQLYRAVQPLSRRMNFSAPWLGWLVTVPSMMLGWIPFRAASVGDALTMMRAVGTPSAYIGVPGPNDHGAYYFYSLFKLKMTADTYLVCLLGCLGLLIAYWCTRVVLPWLSSWRPAHMVGETCVLAVVIAMDFIYLRPIEAFIYFQF
jgi:alginate O-acetyltransferase complex protein AlgI